MRGLEPLVLCNSKGEAASRRGLPSGVSVFLEGGASSHASVREPEERSYRVCALLYISLRVFRRVRVWMATILRWTAAPRLRVNVGGRGSGEFLIDMTVRDDVGIWG